ncbi:MAG: hypothetical protein IK062_03120 [Selenomonadaceae bacterium]|nr:hypothetical protein [Selenomonadaceae bacterium]
MWVNSYQELLNFPTYCTEKQKEIHSKENNSEHIAVNKDNDFVRQIKVDGDILPAKTRERRADYLVLDETKKTAYLIELKGSHIKSAFVQLENTDKNLAEALKEHKIYWRVVCGSRTANLKNNEVKKYQKTHPQLIIRRSILRENI